MTLLRIITFVLVALALITSFSEKNTRLISYAQREGPSIIYPSDGSVRHYSHSSSKGNGSSSGSRSGCLIATAAFGNELSPQVQFLRDFRDKHIMLTTVGSSFMHVFNAWYYSFSPYIADYERQQSWLQQIIRTSIHPLLGILSISEKAYSLIPGEYGAIAAGLIASSMIGGLYFSPFALVIKQVRKRKIGYKHAIFLIVAAFATVIGSVLSGNHILMAISSSLFVLMTITFSAIFSARIIVWLASGTRKRIISTLS